MKKYIDDRLNDIAALKAEQARNPADGVDYDYLIKITAREINRHVVGIVYGSDTETGRMVWMK